MKKVKRFLRRLRLNFILSDIICSKFGHRWEYSFTCSDFLNKETHIRRCKTCGEVNHYKEIPSLGKKDHKWVWMKTVVYSKKGAEKRWGKE